MMQIDKEMNSLSLRVSVGQFDGSHSPTLRDVSDEAIDTLVQNIDMNGFCVIPDYIGAADLEHLQCFVEGKVRDSGGGYFRLAGKQDFRGTMLDAIADSPTFISLMHRVYEKGYKKPPPKQQFY